MNTIMEILQSLVSDPCKEESLGVYDELPLNVIFT